MADIFTASVFGKEGAILSGLVLRDVWTKFGKDIGNSSELLKED